ncbi:MAG: Flp pilus assembly protein CpaB [Betaproteobacteria bacterium]|nr:Flp pilus assembly protein CpaB [Betaproteobacteria bacterium]
MAKHRALLLLIVSVLISGIAIWGAMQWMNRQVEKRSVRSTFKVVVATANVSAGSRLTPELLKSVDWPAENRLAGSFSDIQPLLNRVAVVNLGTGEPILEQKLAPVGSRAGLSALINQGMRAVAVRVNDVAGVAGFALPGSYVDVMVNIQDDHGKMVSKIVLQHILVMAAAQDAAVKDDIKAKVVNTVTLEVTPQQAEALDLARSVGNLSLILRNQVDEKHVATTGVRKAELLGAESLITPSAPHVSAPVIHRPQNSVEIIRGASHATTTIR